MPYAKAPVPAGHEPPTAQNWGLVERQVFGAAASVGPVDVLAPRSYPGAHADQFLGGRLGSGKTQKVRLRRPAQSKDRPLLLSILTQASSGDQVRQLQQLLNGRVEPSPGLQDSGIFDSKTLDALLSFQRASGLPADGKVGKNTWTSLLFGDKQRLPMQAPVNVAQTPRGLVNTSKSGIPSWSLKSKFEAVLNNTAPKLPGDLRFTFEQLVSPSHRKSMAETLVSWAVSHTAKTGETIDCGLFLINLGFSSLDAFDVVDDMNDLLGRTANATEERHLEDATAQLARVITAVGVTLFAEMMVRITVKSLTRKAIAAGGGAAVPPAKPAPGRTSARVSSSGRDEGKAGRTMESEQIQAPRTPAQEKAERYKCRKEQIAAGKQSSDLVAHAAAQRFEVNNRAVEKAKLSDNVYDRTAGPPVGWTKATPEQAEALGISRDQLTMPNSDFNAEIYIPDKAVFGNDMTPTLAFKGTSSGEDWKNNGKQGLNMESPYYERAVMLGRRIKNQPIEITGHSLGGGLASAASQASGKSATTFNAAGLNAETVARYGGIPTPSKVQAYRVDGEVLTGLQEQGIMGTMAAYLVGGPIGALAKIGLSAIMPNALGVPHEVPASSVDPVRRHLMGDVIAGIELQKAQDQKTLASATGKSCG